MNSYAIYKENELENHRSSMNEEEISISIAIEKIKYYFSSIYKKKILF